MSKKYRYPGVKPFTFDEQSIFFGRDEDIEKLFRMVSVEKLTVLYGKSGYGKSSLLNAGLMPLLQKHSFKAYPLRFGTYIKDMNISPVEVIKQRIHSAEVANNAIDKLLPNHSSLWAHFKRLQTADNKPLILIFDQFEELFSYPDEAIALLKRELASLLYSSIPQDFRDAISHSFKQNPTLLTTAEMQVLNQPMDIKLVFSIRADRVSSLDRLSDSLPQIVLNWYELGALTREQAEDAVLFPATIKSDNYISPTFDFAPRTLKRIFDHLTTNENNRIESFQLQVICQYCENLVIQRNTANVVLQTDDLPNLAAVFKNHYNSLIQRISNKREQYAARIVVEDQLIVEGNRVTLPDTVILRRENRELGMTAELLRALLDTHLLRSEPNTVGGISYELAHDTLVLPILEVRKVRIEEEERQKAEREKAEKEKAEREKAEREKAEKERELKRQRKIIVIVSVAAVVSIVLAVFSLVQMNAAQKAKDRAEKLVVEVQQKDSLNRLAQFDRFHTEAVSEMNTGNFVRAVELFDYAKDFTSDTASLNIEIDNCRKKAGNYIEFEELLKKAQTLKQQKQYAAATDLYEKAKQLDVSPEKLNTHLQELDGIVKAEATNRRQEAEAIKAIDKNRAANIGNAAAQLEALSRRIGELMK